jgi:hypothetical protein
MSDRAGRRQLLRDVSRRRFLLRDGLGDAGDARQIRTFGCVAVSLNATASFAVI